ncbi:hypothetical protein ACEQ8H_000407 [Pleosporales sp. CAS-2024a]
MAARTRSLPYHEPDLVTILVHASFLLLLHVAHAALDKVLYCGLLGQLVIGMAWGPPGAKWLTASVEEAVVQLGYLGLLLLVYQGGLHTSFPSLKANLLLSAGVALTGICLPIALSYTLQGLLHATPIQAFAAGAALCSTSLGTTFAVLDASRLSASRLGVVLTSAAMMDDVVGLVMVQVISNLGGDHFSWVTAVRPILVSIAFAAMTPVVCLLLVKPITARLNRYRDAHPKSGLARILCKSSTAFVNHTLILLALVAGATYAGTSNLFAAYIAGASISWWDSEVPHVVVREMVDVTSCGTCIYEHYYHAAVSRMLQPFFFASIGFSIPLTNMFKGSIVWRGIVYTLLMAFGKLTCGLWLVRLSLRWGTRGSRVKSLLSRGPVMSIPHLWGKSAKRSPQEVATATAPAAAPGPSHGSQRTCCRPPKPFSLHPPLILGLAMCARGEIGFLISGVAEATGVFSSSSEASNEPSDLFLVVTWAIMLCTVMGPLGVGLSVRRVKKLQGGSGRDVLGVWG